MKKTAIWGENIPYNCTRSKFDDLDIDWEDAKKGTLWDHLMKFGTSLQGAEIPEGRKKLMDTFTYVCEIQRGYEKETYEDVPYIVPMLVPGSDRAVIVVPGGGFGYKASDSNEEGDQYEGDLVAKRLNEAGISAFVLWYRSNPYRLPVPLLDMQRAVRYVRFHAAEYGISPDKIGIMGFSAGGYECAGEITLMRNRPVVCEGYAEDDIDKTDDRVALAGLIYPCITFKYNAPLLCATLNPEDYATAEQRDKAIAEWECLGKVRENDPPQFICYGTDDHALDARQFESYISELEGKGVEHEVLKIPGADHGFGSCSGSMAEMMPTLKEYGYWLDKFTEWADKIF